MTDKEAEEIMDKMSKELVRELTYQEVYDIVCLQMAVVEDINKGDKND